MEIKPNIWIKVESSNISAIKYTPISKTLLIAFIGGTIYQYTPITEAGFLRLAKAESIGKYFFKHIKNNKTVSYEKLGKQEDLITT